MQRSTKRWLAGICTAAFVLISPMGALASAPAPSNNAGDSQCQNRSIGSYYYRHIHKKKLRKKHKPPQPTPQPPQDPRPDPQPEPRPEPQPPQQPAPQPPQDPSPQPPSDGIQLAAEEQKMLDLVNAERVKAGLKPLQADPTLTKLARMKSQDMIDNNYFSHQSPTYGSPFDMMKKYGVTYKTAGENIAGNQTVERAHTALMNSEGHRANILNPKFTHIGIGIIHGGPYGMMFTQMFVGN